jgi:primosomal protein N' (replication factor Y) (superfamily II helicase)
MNLVEVALALPPFATYTYRDPRQGARVPVGAQVVVPLGPRRITGFVVGHPEQAPIGLNAELKAIEDVLEDEPALDPEILELGRWAASYYLAPLGEVLRAALPQGERAAAAKRARLTEEGKLFLKRDREGKGGLPALGLDQGDRALLGRLSKAPSIGVRGLTGTADEQRLQRFEEEGWVEMGDEVSGQTTGRRPLWAVALAGPAPAWKPRQELRRSLYERALAAPGGLALATLSVKERAGLRGLAGEGLVLIEARSPESAQGPLEQPPELNPHQAAALSALSAAVGERFGAFVLQGVTGSGKTEVYLRLIAEARQRGRGALVLVPEIALTPQLAARFRARFGDDVAVLHSGLPPAQRRTAWRRLRAGEVGIALGARSAVFAPVRRLGVVVVDEEHDSSFKQEDGLRYSGRDLALVRAQRAEAVAVLGSATPSLETFRNVEQGRYQRLLLPTRANPAAAARPLPAVEIIDLRRQPPMADGLFSKPLLQAMQAAFAAGEQSILFLNRRGYSPLVLCRSCGYVLRCTQCAVAMTYHQARGKLACHYCGREEVVPRQCPSCRSPKLERLGTGTERVEALVREHFPTARVARLDRDSAGGRGAVLERVLGQVHARAIDILVGTQMVTKGHDFAGVTLVGVLLPDQGMHMPDFRAAERTFQLLEQVAGRAGRGALPGRVLVQTYNPEHPAVAALPTHDYEGFARAELDRRREASYPPFARLIALRLEGGEGAEVRQAATQAAARARAAGGEAVRVKGPAEAPIAVLRNQHRWQVWLAGTDRAALAAAARAAVAGTPAAGVRLVVDVDPQSVL